MIEVPCVRHDAVQVTDVACMGCGDFLCPVCELTLDFQPWCPPCFETRLAEARSDGAKLAVGAGVAGQASWALLVALVVLAAVAPGMEWVAGLGVLVVIGVAAAAVVAAVTAWNDQRANRAWLWIGLLLGGSMFLCMVGLLFVGTLVPV